MVTTAITTSTRPAAPASTSTPTSGRPALWRTGAVAGIVAAAATTLIVVAARAADVPVAIQSERIPLAAFAQFTLAGAVIGVVLAKSFTRWARRPQHTFVRTTLALTALSLVPDAIVDASIGSKLVLMLTHMVAATIVIPALAARVDR